MNKSMGYMSVDERSELAQNNPELFAVRAKEWQAETVTRICSAKDNPGQCEWVMHGQLFRLQKEADSYKDPLARLNFVVAQFYKFLNEHYSGGVMK